MSDFDLKVRGIPELNRALLDYSKKLGVRVAQLAVRNGANFMLKQIRSAAPVKTGRLKRAIKIKNSRINRIAGNGSVGVYITIDPGKSRKDMKGAWYGKFVEVGYNRGSKAVGGHEAVARGIVTRERFNAKRTMVTSKRRSGRTAKPIIYRHGGQRVDGRHFVLNTFNRTKEQTAHIVIDSFELAGKRLAQEIGLGVN